MCGQDQIPCHDQIPCQDLIPCPQELKGNELKNSLSSSQKVLMGTWHGMWQLTDSSCSAKFCHRASNDPWNHGWMLTPSKSMEKLWQRVMGKEREESRAANVSRCKQDIREAWFCLGKTQYPTAGVTVLTSVFSFLSGL